MNRRAIPLKSRVRYEGRAQIIDRRAKIGADLEKLPNPIWRTVGMVLRANLSESAQAANKPVVAKPQGKENLTSAVRDK